MAVVPVTTLAVTTPLPVPKARLSVNQGALSLALQVSVSPPVLLILKVWVAGFAPPCVAAKERLVGLAPMTGGTTGGGATGGAATGGGATGGAATGGGAIGVGVTGGGATGGGATVESASAGVKVARLLMLDSLLAKSWAVMK